MHPYYVHRPRLYRLRDLTIDRTNQIRADWRDLLPLAKGLAYSVTIIDYCSRGLLAWRLFNTMDTSFCVEAPRQIVVRHGTPQNPILGKPLPLVGTHPT